MKNFTVADGLAIKAAGVQAKKNMPALYYEQQTEAFTITTPAGAIISGQAGDYVGYDPSTGNVFFMQRAYYLANFTVVSA